MVLSVNSREWSNDDIERLTRTTKEGPGQYKIKVVSLVLLGGSYVKSHSVTRRVLKVVRRVE